MSRARDIADGKFANDLTVTNGNIKLDGNYPTGTNNVALGDTALDSATSSTAASVAIGKNALTANTGNNNTAVGKDALEANTSGAENTALGRNALTSNTTASNNTGVGNQALQSNTTGTQNVAVGAISLYANTTASYNTAVGRAALYTNTTGATNTAIGRNSLAANTTADNNTGVGAGTLEANTTGANNTALGKDALVANTTAIHNTGIGYLALAAVTTGTRNTCVGSGAGDAITTGGKHTIVGRYNGNTGGLDIRTATNHIVLSDGDGNPRVYVNGSGRLFSYGVYDATTGTGANVAVDSNGHLQRSTSSQRYKNTINDATHGLTELMNLRPVTYKHNSNGDVIFGGLIAEEVHTAGLTEFVEYSQDDNGDDQPEALHYGNMVSLCIKAIQELKTELDAAKARIAALEAG